jgi:hypothetical protein
VRTPHITEKARISGDTTSSQDALPDRCDIWDKPAAFIFKVEYKMYS